MNGRVRLINITLQEIAENIYNIALNSNGFHNFKFYLDTRTNTLIKIVDILKNAVPKRYIQTYYHMGYKYKITDNL